MSVFAMAMVAMAGAGTQGVPTSGENPVLWLDLKGNILIAGHPASARFTPGATAFRTRNGITYGFTGVHGGVLLGDQPALKMGGSITVSTWINPESYVNDGPGAQILFRGDDRCGLDPYTLVIQGDGTINFGISNENGAGMAVKAELPLHQWNHITANYNASNGELRMWMNGDLVAFSKTSARPFLNLDRSYTPGVGIGNVQNDTGPHNQPFKGQLADLRVYAAALTPDEAGYNGPTRRNDPTP